MDINSVTTVVLALVLLPCLAGMSLLLYHFVRPGKEKNAKGSGNEPAIPVVFLSSIICLLLSIWFFYKIWTGDAGLFHHILWRWAPDGLNFTLMVDKFAAFIIMALWAFSLLVSVYSSKLLKKDQIKAFYGYLLLVAGFGTGAVASGNLATTLFFWEGLLPMLYGMIALGGQSAKASAMKCFITVAISDLCLMLGIILVWHLSGTLETSRIVAHRITADSGGLYGVAYILMFIGAAGKLGVIPFHTWIPDAADGAPLPFMAFLPGAVEKLLGVYLAIRVSVFLFEPSLQLKLVIMSIGALTILVGVMMALIQKSFKRLLAYHAVSQVGYMVLGIGTGNAIGIVGGILHMLNNAVYKCSLFMTGGSVERAAGSTKIDDLGGLGRVMPVTFAAFIVSALAISGVFPFNGFFSKEMIFEGTVESGYPLFFILAEIGAVFTFASFLKLGHGAFLGTRGRAVVKSEVLKDSPWAMLAPMLLLAAGCLLFGLIARPMADWTYAMLRPAGQAVEHHGTLLRIAPGPVLYTSICALAIALVSHLYGFRHTGKGARAAEHIYHAPFLKDIYSWAERRLLDPYEQGGRGVGILARWLYRIDRTTDYIVAGLTSKTTVDGGRLLRTGHNGIIGSYVSWSVVGTLAILIIVLLK